MDEKLNIFQSAAENARKPQKISKSSRKPEKIEVYTNPETEKVLAELEKHKKQLQASYAQMAKNMGMTPVQLTEWLEQRSVLNPHEQDIVRELVSDLKHKISQLAVNQKKLRKSEGEVQKDVQNRKAKTLGSRKKWLPM